MRKRNLGIPTQSTAKEFQKSGLSVQCILGSNENNNVQDKFIQFFNMKTTLEYSWYRLNRLLLSIFLIGGVSNFRIFKNENSQILEFSNFRILKNEKTKSAYTDPAHG